MPEDEVGDAFCLQKLRGEERKGCDLFDSGTTIEGDAMMVGEGSFGFSGSISWLLAGWTSPSTTEDDCRSWALPPT